MSDDTIDYSDIPELTDAELRRANREYRTRLRTGHPPLPGARIVRQMIAIRLEPALLRRLRASAAKQGMGYQTLISQILRRHVR